MVSGKFSASGVVLERAILLKKNGSKYESVVGEVPCPAEALIRCKIEHKDL